MPSSAMSDIVGAGGVSASTDAMKRPIIHCPTLRRVPSRRRLFATSVAAALILLAVAVVGVALMPQAVQTDMGARSLAPSLAHPFGTDRLGHDMLVRTAAGLAQSVLIGLLAAGVSALIALALGTAAALGGRKVDAAVTWLIDLMLGIPHIVLLILISYAVGKGFFGVVVGIALTHWPSLARVVRAEVLQAKNAPYVALSRKLGQSRLSVAMRHILPHAMPQFIVGTILLFPHAVLHEASVTFLGFGLSPESAAIGIILSESMSYLSAGMWWLAVFPGLALIAVVMLFDAVGQGLRRLTDPTRAQE
ncbi:MAG: ABC transporter permease [Slackia sp.]|nr:ABC transporter permease [Slackia sp.]